MSNNDSAAQNAESGAPTATQRGRGRRNRSLTAKLGAVVLGFESVIVVLAGLAIFGLRVLPASIPDWWAIVGGVIVALLMVATTTVLDHTWGVAFGWVLQVAVAASALLVPGIWLVVLIFGGMWAYAMIMGPRLDARAAVMAADAAANPTP